MSTVGQRGFLVDTVTPTRRLTFQVNPSRFVVARKGIYGTFVVPGRSRSVHQFVAGGEREFRFALDFYLDGDDMSYVKRAVEWLEAVSEPQRDVAGYKGAPPPVLFKHGELFESVCLILDVQAEYGRRFDPDTLLPHLATVDLVLVEDPEVGKAYRDASSRGTLGALGGKLGAPAPVRGDAPQGKGYGIGQEKAR